MSRFIETVSRGVLILRSPLFEKYGVGHGFTTRVGGVSEGDYASLNLRINCEDSAENVRENLRRVADAVGFSPDRCAMTRQVHGKDVRVITSDEPAYYSARPDCDAVISAVSGHALMSFGADCVTVLLYDTRKGVGAAVHAGWRGAVAGTVACAVEALVREYASDPCDIIAAVGPSISGECYEVSRDVADALKASHKLPEETFALIMPERGEKAYPDLRAFAKIRLLNAGIPQANIDIDTHCTFSEPELLWSHRRTGDRRGVQAAVIVVK